MVQMYVIELKVPRLMSKTDEARMKGRTHVGFSRTFEKLEEWFRDLDDEAVVGKLPTDLLSPETETGILSYFEMLRPGLTSYISNRFSSFLAMQGPVMMERMRTKCSWDPDQAGTQFGIANLTNKGLVDIDMSKTEGNYLDKIAAEDTDSDLDDVFGADRTVQEVSLKQELEDAIKLNDLIRKEITNVQEVNAMSEGAEEKSN